MWFSLGRTENLPSQYDPQYIPVFAYILEKEIIIAFVILLASFVFCFASSGLERIYYRITHVFIALLIGTFILVENFGQEWEIGSVVSKTPYKAGSSCEILANIEVNLGLRSVNITLRTDDNSNCKIKEIINYNERFEWTWDQGRLGFGPYAGRLQQQFRDAQHRGLPLPILWIADYFIIDGEGFRFGRFYRTAGWYAHILLWAAFATWILTIILNQCVIVYGGYFLFVTGCLQLCAVAVWSMVRNPIPLVIIFEDGNITTRYGPSYWFAMANGIFCIALSFIIIVMYHFFETTLYNFFGQDPHGTYIYLTNEEFLRPKNRNPQACTDLEMRPITPGTSTMENEEEYQLVYYKKRSTIFKPPSVNRSNKPNLKY